MRGPVRNLAHVKRGKDAGVIRDIFTPADILIPGGVPLEKWSVIACDQFSSEKEYWARVRENVDGAPSTLDMIIPEAYLDETGEEKKIKDISAAADDYLESGLLRIVENSFIYVERTLADGRIRRGIVGAVDLEEYDFSSTDAAVLASEGTVLERLPARIRIRRAAGLELPHIITFIDDNALTVIEPLSEKADRLPLLYDFDLMEGGGHIKGRRVSGGDAAAVVEAMRILYTPRKQAATSTLVNPGTGGGYVAGRTQADAGGRSPPGGNAHVLMVVGDGNHSLAAAKVYWDELKQGLSDKDMETHPARRALVEVNNVYDDAISFEAIHRVVFDVDPTEFVSAFENAVPRGDDYEVQWISRGSSGTVRVAANCIGDVLGHIQEFLDKHAARSACRVDYIHDAEAVVRLSRQERCAGLILPAMDKSELFRTVAAGGVFPKKSFSVGSARDKRYYLECRNIRS